jgi:hypothetical protein
MRISMPNRCLSLLIAVGYLLTISMASFFHEHAACSHGGHSHHSLIAHSADSHECRHATNEHSPGKKRPASHPGCPTDDGHCSVCQFLGQKPATTPELTLTSAGTQVQELLVQSPSCPAPRVIAAWHSRGPPALA